MITSFRSAFSSVKVKITASLDLDSFRHTFCREWEERKGSHVSAALSKFYLIGLFDFLVLGFVVFQGVF